MTLSGSELEAGRQPGAGRVALAVGGRLFTAAVLSGLVPGARVLAVVKPLRELRQLEGVERVAHHGQLVRFVRPDRLLGEVGLRTARARPHESVHRAKYADGNWKTLHEPVFGNVTRAHGEV